MKGSKRKPRPGFYPVELRRRAVKLLLEEGLPLELIAKETGASRETIREWARRYRAEGEAGLVPRPPIARTRKASSPIHRKIAQVKKEHPSFGVRRIAHWLKRKLFLPASPETVRRTLHKQGLMPKTRKKPPPNITRPRFFERSTPNQMWQSDICTVTLHGKYAYLIGYVDDYSRYITGLGLFRSQTGEHVLEVYRTAVGEYGVPKEMLTDNGRQYASWRGKTRFQQELAKDRVQHILSQPHHPMTLGKIERFWKTIWEEFLERAQFSSFDEAQERVRQWVKYYNHKRPHQSLDGLCPADRFFEIQKDLRKVIESGIAENVEALALDREPKEPFYVVGRMGGKSVMLSVERGEFRMQVDEEAVNGAGGPRKGEEDDGEQGQEGTGVPQRAGEGPGGAGGVDGAAALVGDLPGAGGEADGADQLAGACDGGYAGRPQTASTAAGGAGADAAREGGEAADAQMRRGPAEQAGPAFDEARAGAEAVGEGRGEGVEERSDETQEESGGTGGAGSPSGGADRAGAGRSDHGEGGGAAAGGLAEDLLPVGAPGPLGDGQGAPGQGGRTAVESDRPGERGAEETPGRTGGAGAGALAGGADPGRAEGAQ